MEWLINLFTATDGVAHTVLLLAAVISVGVVLGNVKIGGISLGVTWILFAGILAGHIGFTANDTLLTFLQDFGLVLFVFGIGLQVGPGFFDNFGRGGVRLNMLAIAVIALNIIVMFACYLLFFDHNNFNLAMMTGTLFGAVTNTPGLGAANEAIQAISDRVEGLANIEIANGYACAYPLAVLGIIFSTLFIRFLCRISVSDEEKELERLETANPQETPHAMALRADNAYISGRTILELTDFLKRNFVVSRMFRGDELVLPNSKTVITKGDELYVVCAESDAEAIKAFIGPETHRNFEDSQTDKMQMVSKKVVVTNPKVNGKTLGNMHFSSIYGVNITRITRQGMNFFASKNHHFHIGDKVTVVGPEANVKRVTELLGNAAKRLDHPNIVTIFIGIFLGIIVGQIPINLPNMPVAMKLGVAGGPLIVAILIGRYGHLLKLVTYTSNSANLMLREIGLSLFLACVGIKAGGNFVDTIVAGDGLKYVLFGFLITIIPILIVGPFARWRYKANYFTIMGLVAGTYTDPAALAFANASCTREAPALAYSTVYPLSMFLRILTAQLIILLGCG
ncbi:MAG: putative transporter [Prevotella sp.]|nr:putative transporter [Prevotella sp.]